MASSIPTTPTRKLVCPQTTPTKDLDQALSRIRSYAEIRLFIAGTANFGHQASSVDLLLRLVCDYAYAGLVTVVYDRGTPGCGINVEKLPRLLQRYMDPDGADVLPDRIQQARLEWFSIQDFSEGDRELVDFGLTGGAEIGRIYDSRLSDMLNVRAALIAQPFQWPWCRDGIDFHSTSNRPPVDLMSQNYLGLPLFHTAYRVPPCLYSSLPNDRRGDSDLFLHTLLALGSHVGERSISCVYGLRENGVSHVDPANLLYLYLLALIAAFPPSTSENIENTPSRRILVINFDKFWGDALARLEDYVHGRDPLPTSGDPESLPRSGNLSKHIRCISAPEQLSAAASWFKDPFTTIADKDVTDTANGDFMPDVQAHRVKILYAHVGFVAPESFIEALKISDLPIIFEGQHTASLVASMGKPYLKLQDSVLECSTQVLRIPDDLYRHCDALSRIKNASLKLQHGALGRIDFQEAINCVAALIADFADPTGDMSIYLQDLQHYYQRKGSDKFERLLSAWNKLVSPSHPRNTEGARVRATPKKRGPRTLEEVQADIEMVKNMLSELCL